MKKSLKKVIGTAAAITALTAAMAISASAETAEPGKGITFTAKAQSAGEQVTILVLKPGANATDGITDDEIAYIDQAAAEDLGDGTYGKKFDMPVQTSAGETYSVLTGAETATAATPGTVEIKNESSAVNYGDPSGDNSIDTTDAIMALNMFVGAGTFTDAEKACADVTKDSVVDTTDAIEILNYFVGAANSIDDSWKTNA